MAHSGKSGGEGGFPPTKRTKLTKEQDKFNKIVEGNPDYIVAHTGLSFEQIPSVTGVLIMRQFFPPMRYLSPSCFETPTTWEEIEKIICEYFIGKNISFCLPETIAVFSVKGVKDDQNLIFDIYCCPTNNDTFIVEFRRVIGDAKIFSKIFTDIRSLIAPELTDEDETGEAGNSGGGAGNSGGGAGNSGDFDNYIK